MIGGIDVAAAVAGLPALPDWPADEERTVRYVYAHLGDIESGGVYLSRFEGDTPWERHRGEEFLHVLDGRARLVILLADGPRTTELSPGTVATVPDGCWHKFTTSGVATVLSITPQPTDHSTADDPTAG